jgi:hypothetical protein
LDFHPVGATKYHVMDAMEFVDQTIARNKIAIDEGKSKNLSLYDFIMVDVFDGVQILPSHRSRAFYRKLAALLTPDNGIVVQNLVKAVAANALSSVSGLEGVSVISLDLKNGFNQIIYYKVLCIYLFVIIDCSPIFYFLNSNSHH